LLEEAFQMVRKSKDANAAYMRRYRKKKAEERKLLLKIQGFSEYKALSKADQKAVDQAFLSGLKYVDESLKQSEKEVGIEIETVLRREMAALEKQFVFILSRYSKIAEQLEAIKSEKKIVKIE